MISENGKCDAGTIELNAEHQLSRIRNARALSRRLLFKNLGIAGATIAAGSVLSGCMGNGGAVMAQSVSETDVLNFALNLEYLVSVRGIPLDASGISPLARGWRTDEYFRHLTAESKSRSATNG